MDERRRLFLKAATGGAVLGGLSPLANAWQNPRNCKTDLQAHIAFDMNSGLVLFGDNERAPMQPASMAKMMTLMLIYEAVRDEIYDLAEICHAASLCVARAIARGVYNAKKLPGDPMPTFKNFNN